MSTDSLSSSTYSRMLLGFLGLAHQLEFHYMTNALHRSSRGRILRALQHPEYLTEEEDISLKCIEDLCQDMLEGHVALCMLVNHSEN